ncbi:terminase small subunit [Apilactobacillus micheneri]|uniref:terminase small subunit n=1 Tax=Apilactobacillus micheneri TaxID=1899430 RepID=UPI0011262DFC|nr:terminase small subunit [Apilactobacillus micheneri]TPR43170.1 terminase small subunit [Apilactobacillus micheneri]TPR47258.1 terminase small subunit [Apilactobacillus micheneri]
MEEHLKEIKVDFEAGISYSKIATKYKISKGTISKLKQKYEWVRKGKNNSTVNGTKNSTKHSTVSKNVSSTKLSNSQSTDDKWKEFCFLTLQYHNATQAYAKVYDCSYQTAMTSSSRLLRNVKVKKYMDVLRSESSNELHADLNDVIKVYLKILGADIGNYLEMHSYKFTRLDDDDKEVLDDDGKNVIDCYTTFSLKEPDKQDWSVVKSVHQGKDGLVLETYDKMKAAKELINLLPQGKTSKQTDPVVKAVSDSMKNSVNNDDIEE